MVRLNRFIMLSIAGKKVVHEKTSKHLIIQEGITDIQEIDFWKFTKLETIKLPNSIQVIHDEVFACCHSLTEVDMPGVTNIGSKSFRQCKSLKKIKNVRKVEKIGDEAFMDCYSLTWPSFENQLKQIGADAFFSCTSLKHVVIPDSVTEIKRRAFCYCENLERFVLPASLKKWNKSVTARCPKLKTIVNRSRLSCQIYDFDGYRIWKTNGRHVKSVPAKKTAVASGRMLKIIYKLDGGKKNGKLPDYYEYGTILRIPQTVRRNEYVMAGWDCRDLKSNDKDGIYESVDRRLYLGPVARKPELHPIWFEYSAKNTKNGAVELKVGDPEYLLDGDAAYFNYTVRYSEYKNMKDARSRYISGYPAKAVFRNLKKGKTYYFQVGPVPDEATEPSFWLKKHKIKINK